MHRVVNVIDLHNVTTEMAVPTETSTNREPLLFDGQDVSRVPDGVL